MNLNTKEIIYKMLTENTGIHMCDSGGEDGRMWQRNQKKSYNDFDNEPEITKDDDLIYKSLFHHLSNTFFGSIQKQYVGFDQISFKMFSGLV